MLLNTSGVVRLASDVEIRYTQGGSAIGSFSVVSSDKYKTASGEQKENTCFISVTAFGKLGEICNQYLKKGSKIFISGDLKQDSWTAQDGSKKSKHTITINKMEMLDSKGSGSQQQAPQNTPPPAPNKIPEIDVDDSSIPF